jgi:hypothetical protein
MKLKITRSFVLKYAERYDEKAEADDKEVEAAEKSRLRSCRFLGKDNLIAIGKWKSPRPLRHYNRNDDADVRQVTSRAFGARDEKERIEPLLGAKGGLSGVGYPVASVILHFAFPDEYPILDVRAVSSLKELDSGDERWT